MTTTKETRHAGEQVIGTVRRADRFDGTPDALAAVRGRWRARSCQVGSVYALPLFFGDYVPESVDLLATRPHALGEDALEQRPKWPTR